jgi:hypothetical protein
LPNAEGEREFTGTLTDRLARVLTLLVLAATGLVIVFYLVIATNPATALNPYPPPAFVPSPFPSPATARGSETPASATTIPSAPVLFLSPTPLRPATPTPKPQPTTAFSSTVIKGQSALLLDCTRPLLAGTVTDAEGEPLVGYPIHVWGGSVQTPTIVLSGSAPDYGSSGWEVAVTTGEKSAVLYVQLHLHNVYRVHPPLSDIVRVELTTPCPQAMVLFQERPE